jgi:hypothetical protein
MKIQIEKSGGFAGIIKTITVDTENLPKDIGLRLEEFFSKTENSERRKMSSRKNNIRDCAFYKMSRRDRENMQEVEFTEFDTDGIELKSVIDRLFKTYKK